MVKKVRNLFQLNLLKIHKKQKLEKGAPKQLDWIY